MYHESVRVCVLPLSEAWGVSLEQETDFDGPAV